MINANGDRKTSRFKMLKIYDDINSEILHMEITRRKLPPELVADYLFQVFVLDRKPLRKYMAFAFPNSKDHYEITIPYPEKGSSFKTSIVQNSFTFIEGDQANCIEIFRNVWDFLTWLAMMKRSANKFDAYILNGKRNIPKVIEEIKNRTLKATSIVDFTDNESDGDEIRKVFSEVAEECNLKYGAQNYIFSGYGSLSEYWMMDSEAPSLWPILQ